MSIHSDGGNNPAGAETVSAEELPKWRPLNSTQRRVLGVLVEKAKTTPEAYPLTVNALVTGSNQKSNREPKMDLSADEVDTALEQLREMEAVGEIHNSGRTLKYRHHLYEWLGVEAAELAVVAELLLRGAQTVGDLRARAARMAKIPGLDELRPILDALEQKGLVVFLTPPGRGQIVTHNLYPQKELEEVRRAARLRGPTRPEPATPAPRAAASPNPPSDEMAALRREIQEIREELKQVRQDVSDLWENLR